MGEKKALLFGASGFIGGYLLAELLENPAYRQVTVVVRKPLELHHPKLQQLIGDYDSLSKLQDLLTADDVFCALGTTRKKTPDKKLYYQIDHDYPVKAAAITKENGATAYFLVSSIGADEHSSVFYTRTKGETERDIIALDFERTHIFRPSALTGDRAEKRTLEKVSGKIIKGINGLFRGSWTKYRSIDGQEVARAMNSIAANNIPGVHYYHWDEIKKWS